jgi:LCP family protein required for cell wall assembly
MGHILTIRREQLGRGVLLTVAVLAAVSQLTLLTSCSASQSGDRVTPEQTASQIEVVITPEATLTPENSPTPQLAVTPYFAATPAVSPTAPLTLSGSTVPAMDLNALPLRQCASCINILLLGIDARPGENVDTANTDTMIVLSFNTATHTAGMLGIPRDLWVPQPGRNTPDRINTAMAYGGIPYAVRTVEYNIGIPIQHYVRVSFDVVTALVNLVGGIDVNVDQNINDPYYPSMNYGYDPFVISKGWHHMDGATALKYARTRHQTSDFFRMRRQQQIIMALRDRVLSTNALPQLLAKAPQIMSALNRSITTDLSISDIVQLALLVKDLPTDKITRITLDGAAARDWITPGGAEVLVPNRERINQLTAQFLNQAWAPERVALLNATQTKNTAERTATYLSSKGYHVVRAGDAPDVQETSPYSASVIYDYYGNSQFAQNLASALGLSSSAIITSTDTYSNTDVLVILGNDYHLRQ